MEEEEERRRNNKKRRKKTKKIFTNKSDKYQEKRNTRRQRKKKGKRKTWPKEKRRKRQRERIKERGGMQRGEDGMVMKQESAGGREGSRGMSKRWCREEEEAGLFPLPSSPPMVERVRGEVCLFVIAQRRS